MKKNSQQKLRLKKPKLKVRNNDLFNIDTKQKFDKTLYVGADISINHSAVVLRLNNKTKFFAITELKKICEKYDNIYNLDNSKSKTSSLGFNFARSNYLYSIFKDKLFRILEIENWCYDITRVKCFIEGYAYGAKGKLAEIGEVSQSFKLALNSCISIDEIYNISPKTLKKFITNDSSAHKNEMQDLLYEKYNVSFSEYNVGDVAEDLVDAYSLSQFGIEFDQWQVGGEHSYFDSLKRKTLLGFRR